MSYLKNFVAGAKLLASQLTENFGLLEPFGSFVDNVPGYLTGGTSVSALAVFQTLADGANDGKIKINVDGVVYDNVAINLRSYGSAVQKIAQNTNDGGDWIYSSAWWAQTFTVPASTDQITALKFNLTKNGSPAGVLTAKFRTGNTPGAGSVIETIVIPNSTASGMYTWTLATPRACSNGETYHITLEYTGPSANWAIQYSQLGGYAGGTSSKNGTPDSKDWNFEVWGAAKVNLVDLAEVATKVEIGIRAVTGGRELVTYSTNKFIITSGVASASGNILKLMTPATGTDISGNNATRYLDCGVNGTETAGTSRNVSKVAKTEATFGRIDGGLFDMGWAHIMLPVSCVAGNRYPCFAGKENVLGNYFYFAVATTATNIDIYRIERQAGGNMLYKGVKGTITVASSAFVYGVAVFDNGRVYVWYRDNTTAKLKEFDENMATSRDITGLPTADNASDYALATDGTSLFVKSTTTLITPYTISGLTATAGAGITLSVGVTTGTTPKFRKVAGGNIYTIAQTHTVTSLLQTIKKYNSAGTYQSDITFTMFRAIASSQSQLMVGFVRLGNYPAIAWLQNIGDAATNDQQSMLIIETLDGLT